MLSYRHGFHAGNFADVLKHLVQVEILAHMLKKDKAFDYIDTHAGAGLYRLGTEMAAKNQEYQTGIGHLLPDTGQWPEMACYLNAVKAHNPDAQLQFYPGSPAIAADLLRPYDRGWLFELHPADSEHLRKNFRERKQFIVRQQDGFRGLSALLPSQSRRAFVLIDPPYEMKADYQRVVEALKLIHRKMSTATVAIWYPVVDRKRIEQLQRQIVATGIRRIVQFELGIKKDSAGHGMTSSGIIVLNPPWTLTETMGALLPRLAEEISEDGGVHYRCETLVPE
ncbi:23S rRNA (adenine(2030)-N(6))-methyltransferase RlmJ [Microbulbifer hainanensis]|uniref:23S rRNA (adenine(2030)-N(6))-methyltransferase RlmJ n=1 Tax=Microbulbifer hainanensis TaxID=2735675 RepID=UPI00186871DD|nr:23S rRNA (adenine(2030)-N(6))-methyltransferase RlmJ [Microbulbifer hainanensis]